jgi:hypothetical protein
MSNFHQSFGSRFPAVGFPRNCCGCSSVAILYTAVPDATVPPDAPDAEAPPLDLRGVVLLLAIFSER